MSDEPFNGEKLTITPVELGLVLALVLVVLCFVVLGLNALVVLGVILSIVMMVIMTLLAMGKTSKPGGD
ncbi:MAG: hypothetical protein AAFX81_10700 [Pseudomonadota bacterium]